MIVLKSQYYNIRTWDVMKTRNNACLKQAISLYSQRYIILTVHVLPSVLWTRKSCLHSFAVYGLLVSFVLLLWAFDSIRLCVKYGFNVLWSLSPGRTRKSGLVCFGLRQFGPCGSPSHGSLDSHWSLVMLWHWLRPSAGHAFSGMICDGETEFSKVYNIYPHGQRVVLIWHIPL